MPLNNFMEKKYGTGVSQNGLAKPRAYTSKGGFGGMGTALSTGGYSYATPQGNVSAVPTISANQPTFLQGLSNKYAGTSNGIFTGMNDNNTFSYMGENGMQMQTGDLSSNPEAMTWLRENPNGVGEGTSKGLGFGDYANMGLNAVNAFNMYNQGKLAKEQLGLAKEQFGFEKASANRAIQNQASQYNTGLQNAGEVGMALAGNTMDPNQRAARQAQLDTQKLSTAAIG